MIIQFLPPFTTIFVSSGRNHIYILKETLYIFFTHTSGNSNGGNVEAFRFETLDGLVLFTFYSFLPSFLPSFFSSFFQSFFESYVMSILVAIAMGTVVVGALCADAIPELVVGKHLGIRIG